jgi:DNA-binding beta-propeller fold protein YncE
MKLFTVLLACTSVCVGAEDAAALKLTRTIPLPGVAGRFDHFALDVRGHRLFVAALGNDTLEVVDVQAGSRLHTVTGLSKPTGVVYLADGDRIGVANGGEGSFTVLDGASYSVKAIVRRLDDADNVRLDGQSGFIFIGYGNGAVAILTSRTVEQTGSIPPGHPNPSSGRGEMTVRERPGSPEVCRSDRRKVPS